MNKNLPFMQWQLGLPSIDSIDNTEQAFGDAFLSAGQILYKYLLKIKSNCEITQEFSGEPFNLAVLGLFAKMCRSYYSYILLEVHKDRSGSQIFIEHLCETTLTLTYLLEEVDKSIFAKYIQASIHQAGYLLIQVKEQLIQAPSHPDLLKLQNQLENFISKQEQSESFELLPDLGSYLWGSKTDNTAKRGAVVGLNFLSNPARQIATNVIPASYLDIQLNYLHSKEQSSQIDFTALRDAAYLCLHATQAFLEEVFGDCQTEINDLEEEQQTLNALYEWFYNAHIYYQMQVGQTGQKQNSSSLSNSKITQQKHPG
ncbi:DUF5677 domain-containing protein [Aliterella atlantica]|uniref:Uncharacterized protein n=1 Tax=Aliterella atlantica CENA595 TaxID=1618023 RepID=A0A0D8ZNM7_9CYAN|nr:hypothetical protein [Aliterella atlantica]KJH70350.1 hypothetical protein UH38_18780 [Aliterella atlantica CENA595]